MKLATLLLCALLLSMGGCVLISGQITTSFNLGNIHVTGANDVEHKDVDLNTNSDYADHKDNLKGLADLAVLGTVENLGQALGVEVWLTADNSSYTTAGDVKAHGIKLWGKFDLAVGETKVVDWDASAGLFTAEGKAALITEILGDGKFSVYALGGSGDYSFNIPTTTLVLVIDAGV